MLVAMRIAVVIGILLLGLRILRYSINDNANLAFALKRLLMGPRKLYKNLFNHAK